MDLATITARGAAWLSARALSLQAAVGEYARSGAAAVRLASSDARGLLEATAAVDGRLTALQRRLLPIVAERDGQGSTPRAYAANEVLEAVRDTQAENAAGRTQLMGQLQAQGGGSLQGLGALPVVGLVVVLKFLAGVAAVVVTVEVIRRVYAGFGQTARQESAVAALERIDATPGISPTERERRRRAVLEAMDRAKGKDSPWPWVVGVVGAAAAAAWVGTRASQGRPIWKANPAQLGMFDRPLVKVRGYERRWPS